MGSEATSPQDFLNQGYLSAIERAQSCRVTNHFPGEASPCFLVLADGTTKYVEPSDQAAIDGLIASLQLDLAQQQINEATDNKETCSRDVWSFLDNCVFAKVLLPVAEAGKTFFYDDLFEKVIVDTIGRRILIDTIGKTVIVDFLGRTVLIQGVYGDFVKPVGTAVVNFGKDLAVGVYTVVLKPVYEDVLRPVALVIRDGVVYVIVGPTKDSAPGSTDDLSVQLPVLRVDGDNQDAQVEQLRLIYGGDQAKVIQVSK